jgi:putative MATE family efflux protein
MSAKTLRLNMDDVAAPAAIEAPRPRQPGRGGSNLIEGPVGPTLLRFSLPILASNALQSLNGSINTFWIGTLIGPAALSASANSTSVLFFLISVGMGFLMAASILIAQAVGAGDITLAKRVIGAGIVFVVALSVVMAVVGYIFASHVLRLMGAPPETLPLASAYLRVIFLALPGLFLFTFAMMALRGAGDSKTPFVFMAIAAVLDVTFNPLFIRGLGPIPAMGIAGAAWSTLISQWIGLLALVYLLYRRRHFIRLRRDEMRYLRIDPTILKSFVLKGGPMGLHMIVLTSSLIALVTLVNRFGYLTVAAYGACFQLWNYIQMPAFAVGQAVSAMAAQNIGAGRWPRVRRIAMAGIVYTVLLTAGVVGVLTLTNRWVLGLFLGGDLEAIAIAQHIDYIVSWSFILFGVNFVLSSVVRAAGAVIPPLIMLFFAMWVVRLPVALALMPSLGADAVWWGIPLGSTVSVVLTIAYYRWGGWTKAHMLEPATA